MSGDINVQKPSFIWLDDCAHSSPENVVIQQYLRQHDDNLKIFGNTNECKQYVESQPSDARITLIVNGKLGEKLVPEIHSLQLTLDIYIFCMNKEHHEKWASSFTKVKGVFVTFDDLKNQLPLGNISNNNDNSVVTDGSANDTPGAENVEFPSISEVDCSYLISDNCFDYLARMKLVLAEKDEFISFCQNALQGNDKLLSILKEFQEGYSPDTALKWLNRDPFFYLFIENIFKMTYIDAMIPCRAFIHDIQKQLEKHKCTSTIEVYYNKIMSNELFRQLANSNGKIIAMKSFLFTNSDKNTVLSNTSAPDLSNGYKRILFTIEANPQIKNVKPFAKIGSLGNSNNPNDVLFMIGSLFKINEIQDEKDGIINIKMTLCANDDTDELQEFFNRIKCQYMDSNGETDLIGFGQFLCAIGQSMGVNNISISGENLIQTCLEKLPNDDLDRVRCYDVLGKIHFNNKKLDSSLDYYNKSLEIKKAKLKANEPSLAESYSNMAIIYLQQQQLAQAQEYFKQSSVIYKELYGDEHVNLIFCYNNMATIHEMEERYQEALSCYLRVLSIMVKHNLDNDTSLAAIYNNLGKLYTHLKQYRLALGFYNESLEIKLKLPTPVHLSIGITYKNIGLVYGYMANVQQSKVNLDKAAEIFRLVYPAEHECIKDIEELIQNLPSEST